MKWTPGPAFKWVLPTSLIVCAPLTGHTGEGPYVGAEGGMNWESPQNYRADGIVIDRLHFDRGWAAGLLGGYSFANGFRTELELVHRRNNLSHDDRGALQGRDYASSAFGNLWYDFNGYSVAGSRMHPYLGGGLGAVRSYYGDASRAGVRIPSDYATEFGYQAGAGMGIDVTSQLTVSLDYRHVWTNRGSFHDTFAAPRDVTQRYLADTALLSVRYYLAAPSAIAAVEPPPPPAPPVAAALPPPPPPPPPVVEPCRAPPGFQVDANCRIIEQKVVLRAVDFVYNSAQLTEPARQTLDQVATALAAQPNLAVAIQGYTDSTGSAEYNLNLSQRRADSAKAYLVTKGIDASTLTARGYGEADPVASNATAEGRAQNRRVEFEVRNAPAHVTVESPGASRASTEAARPGDPVKTGE